MEKNNGATRKNIDEALSLLESWIQNRIESFDQRRKYYRLKTQNFTMLSIGISSCTTILIGVGRIYESKEISIISLITSASLGFITTWENLFSYKQRWIENNET